MKNILAVAVTAAIAVGAESAPQDIRLPPETTLLKPSSLPGFEIASRKCTICHSADYIAYQPPNMSQSQWTAEVAKMRGTYGAPLEAAEVQLVGIYLAATYGDAQSVHPADLALALPAPGPRLSAEAPSTKTQALPDVRALLDANACLSCHALDHKIVGPAYRDVAAKYKSDPQATAKIEESIRRGGVGRWGQTPMPPFSSLDEPQLKALAEYVLSR